MNAGSPHGSCKAVAGEVLWHNSHSSGQRLPRYQSRVLLQTQKCPRDAMTSFFLQNERDDKCASF
jgi:hypothetical protein